MAYPRRGVWDELAARGFRHVVDLTCAVAKYDPSPLTSHASPLADLVARREPPDPAHDEAGILAAADLVADRWWAGEGVVVHCHGGRGRTGAVLGTALVRMGHDADDIVDWLHRVQRTRGRRGWPEQAWQAEVVRRAVRRGTDGV
jgi:protein-tyrosine phosphatase